MQSEEKIMALPRSYSVGQFSKTFFKSNEDYGISTVFNQLPCLLQFKYLGEGRLRIFGLGRLVPKQYLTTINCQQFIHYCLYSHKIGPIMRLCSSILAILTIRMATKQAIVVFQSRYEEALPTRTLQKMKSPRPSLTPSGRQTLVKV